ncbi:MAG: CARDB domain-containing protein, partial [Saprospiraceae bacterium]
LPGGQLAVELFSGACDQPVSISCALNQPAIFANLTIGQTYFIRLADSAYPAYSGSFRLQPQHTFLISPGAEANICSGQSITLSASGGTSYSWSNNQTGPSITVHPTENTQYWVLINKNSCAEQRTIQVMVTPPSYIYPDKPVVYVCENNSIQLEARQATTAGWSTGQTSLNIIFTPTMDSTLLFLEASSGQCIFYDTVKVKLSHGYPDKPKNLLPDSLSGVQDEDLYLEWSPVPGAKSYDVYFWPAGTTKPDQPLFINSKLNRVFLSIPNPTYNSTYFWQVSALNEACETYSDIQKFVLRNLPDLEVSNIQLPDHLISGEDITISYTVRNNGPGYTGFNKQWFDLIYFSDDTTLQTMVDPKLGNVGNLSALYPGETYTRSATFHIPIDPVFSGVFHVIIDAAWRLKNTNLVKFPQVNYGNDIKPSIETVTVVLPDESDLQVVAGNCPLNFFSNSKIPLSWAVQNKGLGRTNKPHWNDVVRLVQDTVTMAGAITIGTAARDTVLFKDSTYYRHILSNKIPPEISGPYYVVIAADDNNDVWEHVLETNNRRVIPVNVVLAAAPDLVPRVLQLPDTIKYGIPFFGKLGVLNQGLVPCDGPVSHKMTLQKVQPQQGDQIVTHYFAQDQWLNAGDSLQSSGYFTVDMAPSSSPLPGAYRPTVQVDASDAVFEYTGENNNERSYQKQVVLVAPDLVITSISTNLTNIIAGDLLKVSYEVLNQGPDFLQKTWADSIYVTNNNSPFGPKVLVREVTNQQLKTFFHNERRTYTLDIALPCNFTEGAYYVWAKADIYGEVVESNDQNNRSTAFAFQVQTGDCQADLAVSHLVVSDSIGYCTEYTVAYTIKNVYYKPVVYGGNCDALAGIFPNHDL